MVELTENELNEIVRGINRGISDAYIYVAYQRKVPQKEVLIAAKSDLERFLDAVAKEDTHDGVLRLRKYSEIVDLLRDIPEQELPAEEDFMHALRQFTNTYDIYFQHILEGNPLKSLAGMIKEKYALIAEKTRIADKTLVSDVLAERTNGTAQKLIRLANIYLELLDIGFKKRSDSPPSYTP